MTGAFIQLGQNVVPISSVHHIDLNYQSTQDGGTTTSRAVRVWYNQGLTNPGSVPAPSYADFRGADAQAIRRNMRNLGNTGQLTVLLGSEEEGGESPAKANAAKR